MKYHIAVLVSHWYYQRGEALRGVREAADHGAANGHAISIMVDSGAFSADTQGHTITVAQYAQWLTDLACPILGPRLTTALSLDVLRDPAASRANWLRLREMGHETVPVTHLGDPPDVLDAYVAEGARYIALGAMVGRSITRKLRWATHLHHHVRERHPDVRLHGLGVGGQKIVEALPWYSVDSSGFGSAYRYGRLRLFDPDRRAFIDVQTRDRRSLHRHGRLLRTRYGLSPGQLYDEGVEKGTRRAALIRASSRSLLLWQTSLQQRRSVSPPPGLRHLGPTLHYVLAERTEERFALSGPIIHFVDGSITHVQQHLRHPA